MGTDGACGLLFCALSGAAPFIRKCRLGWGPLCYVSAVSRGRSPGNCFPQLGPGFLYERWRSGYKPFSLVPNPDGVVVWTV